MQQTVAQQQQQQPPQKKNTRVAVGTAKVRHKLAGGFVLSLNIALAPSDPLFNLHFTMVCLASWE